MGFVISDPQHVAPPRTDLWALNIPNRLLDNSHDFIWLSDREATDRHARIKIIAIHFRKPRVARRVPFKGIVVPGGNQIAVHPRSAISVGGTGIFAKFGRLSRSIGPVRVVSIL